MLVENVVFYSIETRRIHGRNEIVFIRYLCMRFSFFFFRVVKNTNIFEWNWNKHYTMSKLIRVKSNLVIYRVLNNFFFLLHIFHIGRVLSMLEINASLGIKLKLVIMHAQALSQARDSPSYFAIVYWFILN